MFQKQLITLWRGPSVLAIIAAGVFNNNLPLVIAICTVLILAFVATCADIVIAVIKGNTVDMVNTEKDVVK